MGGGAGSGLFESAYREAQAVVKDRPTWPVGLTLAAAAALRLPRQPAPTAAADARRELFDHPADRVRAGLRVATPGGSQWRDLACMQLLLDAQPARGGVGLPPTAPF